MRSFAKIIAILLLVAAMAIAGWGHALKNRTAPASPPSAPAEGHDGRQASNATQTSALGVAGNPGPAKSDPANPESPLKTEAAPLTPALAHALALYRTGKFDAAISEYTAIIAGGGADTPGAYAGLARVYLKQKRPEDAYPAAQKAIEAGPNLADAHVVLAEVYFRQGKMNDSEHTLATLLNQRSKDDASAATRMADARAWLVLSRIYRATSNYKLSKDALDRAHGLDSADPDIRRAWLGTLSLKDRLQAIEEYLARGNNDDAESLEYLKHSMVVLQDEMNRPVRGCRLITKIASTQTNLEPLMVNAQRVKGYGLKVKLNDTMSRLLLDTGAGGILVNNKIAERAGVQRVVEQNVKGIGDAGGADGYVGYVDAIQIGALQFQNCYVRVVDKKSSMDEDGYIGADVFAHFLVDINFPDGKFDLSELPKLPDEPFEETSLDSHPTSTYRPRDRYVAPEMKEYTRIYRFGHQLLVPTSVNGHPYRFFLLDTGAFDDTITPGAARETTKIHADDRVHVKGFSGEMKNVYVADDVDLAFGHFKQRRSLVSFDMTNLSNSIGTEVSGTLGFGMLYLLDIKIDYRDGLVDFSFDPNRLH
jgi:tetratricopeptide (TPR) repeat protein